MKFFFCLHTAAIAIVIVVSKLECKVITYFIPSVGGDLNLLGNFFQENKIKSLKIFLNLDNYEQNRRGKGSRLIISATPSLQTFPQARHKSSCGRRNARAVGPIMIEGLLACSCSKDTIAQV